MTKPTTHPGSVLATLRQMMPNRALEAHEASFIAERQALKLLALLEQHEPAVNVGAIADLPRLEVRVEPRLPISGFSQWSKGRWLIGINMDDAPVRRRFTLAHEFKHVLDHPFIDRAYPNRKGQPSEKRAELICDLFAACLLMPRPWVKKAWMDLIQDQRVLAEMFGVSEAAMSLRLRQLGITSDRPRWPAAQDDEGTGDGRYFRRGTMPSQSVAATVVPTFSVEGRG